MSHQTNVAGRASWKDLPLACLSKWQYRKLIRYKAQHLRGCAPCPFLQFRASGLCRVCIGFLGYIEFVQSFRVCLGFEDCFGFRVCLGLGVC